MSKSSKNDFRFHKKYPQIYQEIIINERDESSYVHNHFMFFRDQQLQGRIQGKKLEKIGKNMILLP